LRAGAATAIVAATGEALRHEATMKIVVNKTQKTISVPLPRGKTLHLGPGKTGQISSAAAEHPQLRKLVDGGEIEVFDDRHAPIGGTGDARKARPSVYGHPVGSGTRRSGDR
jgi:hypothetical protein